MKIRTLIYIVILLLIVNVAAIATMVFYRMAPTRPMFDGRFPGRGAEKMPQFSKQEREIIERSRKYSDSLLSPVMEQMDQQRHILMEELSKDDPDTIVVSQIIEKLGTFHSQVQKQMIGQFLSDRHSFRPEQRARLLKMIEDRSKWQQRGQMGGMRMRRDKDN